MTDDLITRKSVINEITRFRGYLDDDMIFRLNTTIKRLPTIEAIPVEWIEAKKKRLRDMRMNLNSDEVYTAWYFRAKTEVLEELLSEWAERKDE